ncbi:hypothetical protein J2W28_006950 [Variovorax boronicumulans]|uniref:hypothetical protein n=1 Tax=Variovorax boronicumulans TaxID=436515 RepID=UPI00278ABBF4|nr:hypothetical protein [Variovorax boronicumulans]MDP9996471.1 hypothetical protein [Variovorax boronicumulans]MDQ0007771.1 hypothetical protein [Variovorax boronicumulans]
MSRHLYAAVSLSLLLAASQATAQTPPSQPSSLEDQTFFGYTIDGLTPRKGWKSELPFRLGNGQLWHDEFSIPDDRRPTWVTDRLNVSLYTTADGVVQEARFQLNTFKTFSEQFTPALRKQRYEELVQRLSERFGARPSERKPLIWKLSSMDARVPNFDTETTIWKRPWGTAQLTSCSYRSYPYYTCDEKGYAAVLLVQSNAILQYYREEREATERARKATDAQRTKM